VARMADPTAAEPRQIRPALFSRVLGGRCNRGAMGKGLSQVHIETVSTMHRGVSAEGGTGLQTPMVPTRRVSIGWALRTHNFVHPQGVS
jgi:hypothetical protein